MTPTNIWLKLTPIPCQLLPTLKTFFCFLLSLNGNFSLLHESCCPLIKIQEASIQLYPQQYFNWPPISPASCMIWAVLENVLGCHWSCSTSGEFMYSVVPSSQSKDDGLVLPV